MLVQDAQREMRSVYVGGAIGQFVSGTIWLISAILLTFVGTEAGVLSLFFGGMFIFPLTQLALKLSGRSATPSKDNPLFELGRQVALVGPLCLPVIYLAIQANLNWFYPAFLIVIGAHYLPFTFMYGTRLYLILAALMVVGGVAIVFFLPDLFWVGGWFGAVVLLVFAFLIWREVVNQEEPSPAAQ